MNTDREYAIVWFEGEDIYTLVDTNDKTVLLTESEALSEAAQILRKTSDVEDAEEDLRYAIPAHMLNELFGWNA